MLQLRDVKVLDVRIAMLQMQLGAVMDMVEEVEVAKGNVCQLQRGVCG